MMKLTLEGVIIAVHENKYTNEETKKEYQSFRIFLLDQSNNYNPTLAVNYDYQQGLADGLDNPAIREKLTNQRARLTTSNVRTYQGKIIPTFDSIELLHKS